MNKKFLTLIFMFVIMCFISVVDVRALTTCNYGIKENDSDTWQPFIQISFSSFDGAFINATGSQVSENIKATEGYFSEVPPAKSNAILVYNTKIKKDGTEEFDWNDDEEGDRYYFYVKLFADNSTYNDLNGECPKSLYYETIMMKDNFYYYHLKIAPDDAVASLAEMSIYEHYGSDDKGDNSLAAEKFGLPSTSGILVEDDYADKKEAEYRDVYSCQSYSIKYQAMVEAIENDEDKSCDNNVVFNKKYQELQDLCSAYRATSEYYDSEAEDSEGKKGKVSNCQKACSVLKDDVATICGQVPDGGYCGSLGNRVVNWIFKIFGIVRYAVPAILIILSVLDYIKAIAADNEDEMKKVTSRFFKRLIAAALIFLLPLILDFILKLFNIPGLSATNPFCAE